MLVVCLLCDEEGDVGVGVDQFGYDQIGLGLVEQNVQVVVEVGQDVGQYDFVYEFEVFGFQGVCCFDDGGFEFVCGVGDDQYLLEEGVDEDDGDFWIVVDVEDGDCQCVEGWCWQIVEEFDERFV